MKYLLTALALLTVVLSGHLQSADTDQRPTGLPDVTVDTLVYAVYGERSVKLTLFRLSKSHEPSPGIVFIHGGGWRGGNPQQFAPQARILAAKGFVCACIEYRLSGEAKFPAQIRDVKCAIRWMRAHAGEYAIDPERIAVSGGSAGGHLALLAGTSDGVMEFEGAGGWADQSSRVQCVVAFNPAAKIVGWNSEAITALMGKPYSEIPREYEKAQPSTWLDGNDPPMLLLHGTADKSVPFSIAGEFVQAALGKGIEAKLIPYEGASHGFFNNAPYFEPTTAELLAFLIKHFK